MSTVSSSTNAQTLQALYQQRRSDFNTMTSDVKAGDIKGAQSALSSLQQVASNIQGLVGTTQVPSQYSQLQNDFSNLISSIQSGVTGNAQSALSALQTLLPTSSSDNANAAATGAAGTTAAAGVTGSSGTTGATGTTGTTSSSLSQELAALIQAVQSGNLSGAQQDLSQLQSSLPVLTGGHHHHHAINTTAPLNDSSNTGTGTSTGNGSSASSSASAYASMMNMQATSPAMSTMA